MPAAPRDWAEPFMQQAREDLEAARELSPQKHASTLCMLLQMVYEKIAKAAYARSGNIVTHSHYAATFLFQMLRRHPRGSIILGTNSNVQNFVMQLENANPAVAGRGKPILEYPWEENGVVMCPAIDLPLVKRIRDPKGRTVQECLIVARALEKELFTIIP